MTLLKLSLDEAGHITKMTAMPIYGINPLKIFQGTSGPILTKPGMKHRLKLIIFYLNDNPGFTYFTARSNFATQTFKRKCDKAGFLKIKESCGLEFCL